jgi:hypothetical protein
VTSEPCVVEVTITAPRERLEYVMVRVKFCFINFFWCTTVLRSRQGFIERIHLIVWVLCYFFFRCPVSAYANVPLRKMRLKCLPHAGQCSVSEYHTRTFKLTTFLHVVNACYVSPYKFTSFPNSFLLLPSWPPLQACLFSCLCLDLISNKAACVEKVIALIHIKY